MTKDSANTEDSVTQTEADKIWAEIKDKQILMFSIPGRKVSDFCQPHSIEPSRCFLTTKASATLPALEEALVNKDGSTDFECGQAEKYIIISRKPKRLF